MNNYLRRYEESLQPDADLPPELLDQIAQASAEIGSLWGELVEIVQVCANNLLDLMPELVRWVRRYVVPHVITPDAMAWALDTHPDWVKIYRRTKSGRIRKKYRDRIMREYINR